MQNAINLIKKFFDNNDWAYQLVDGDTFGAELELDGPVGSTRILVVVQQTNFAAYAYLPNKPEKAAYPRVAEFLHRVNNYMPYGNFEFDYNDGEIRYKVFTDFECCKLSYAVVDNALTFAVGAIVSCGSQLLRAMYGSEDVEKLYLEYVSNA